jgi:hypothetical protein
MDEIKQIDKMKQNNNSNSCIILLDIDRLHDPQKEEYISCCQNEKGWKCKYAYNYRHDIHPYNYTKKEFLTLIEKQYDKMDPSFVTFDLTKNKNSRHPLSK